MEERFEINLTVKEFGLLLFLIRNAGKALTRDAIRQALWKNTDLYTGSRAIDVHVQHLRAKIEDNASDPKLDCHCAGCRLYAGS